MKTHERDAIGTEMPVYEHQQIRADLRWDPGIQPVRDDHVIHALDLAKILHAKLDARQREQPVRELLRIGDGGRRQIHADALAARSRGNPGQVPARPASDIENPHAGRRGESMQHRETAQRIRMGPR